MSHNSAVDAWLPRGCAPTANLRTVIPSSVKRQTRLDRFASVLSDQQLRITHTCEAPVAFRIRVVTHVPEKHGPDNDPGWVPVSDKDMRS